MSEPESSPQRVTVVDFDMPLFSMMAFMLKWSVAAIPAILILGSVVGFLAMLFGGMALLL